MAATVVVEGEKLVSPENILLRLSEEDEARVRHIFAELELRGFPRQNQTPHITITFATTMDAAVVDRAAELLPPLVPCTLERVGQVIFGTKRKQTIAWLLDAPWELEAAARELSALNPQGRGPTWTPHLTMGLRIPRPLVHSYAEALDEVTSAHFKLVTAQRAVYYKPSSGTSIELQ